MTEDGIRGLRTAIAGFALMFLTVAAGIIGHLGVTLAKEGQAMTETQEIRFEKRAGYGLNTPFYAVADMERSFKFYVEAFGFTLENVMRGDDGQAFHGEFQVDGETVLMIGPEGGEGPHGVSPRSGGYAASFNGYFYVSDVDAFVARAGAGGAEIVEPPTDQFWGDRTAYLKDPDGYLWMIATRIATAAE